MTVIPAQAKIQFTGLTSLKINQIHNLDSRMRGNDESGVYQSALKFAAEVP
ncbi:MAG: hypothetical protein Q8M09_11650 [Pseudomonadota bacterium]|nr:hypothetical protein [Pseudomonadota bacterium]MDP1904883.1 hypothetical protein [Pseudomonadota bacterium]MDP2353412.1 hypothetical protein [Pseudomonadota bacterium]